MKIQVLNWGARGVSKVNIDMGTKDRLIQSLKDFFSKHGKVPTCSDAKSSRGDLYSHRMYLRTFGNWNSALISAGLIPNMIHIGKQTHTCSHCGKPVIRNAGRKIWKHVFCNHSCATTFSNTHKTKGYRRSKLEEYIETRLKQDYPLLTFVFNDKTVIGSELDIYIPSLKLAFELNGIFHYEPIYSEDQFKRVKNNDQQKLIQCYKRGIELCVIDTSQQQYFKESTSIKYYDIIITLINNNLVRCTGIEPVSPHSQ